MRMEWPKTFTGRDRILISNTRFFTVDDHRIHEFSTVTQAELLVLNRAFDRIVDWCLDTLNSTLWGIRCWLQSPKRNEPNRCPFTRPQNKYTMTRYVEYWKQFIYYCFRTMCLEPDRPRILYGIEFTAQQSQLIQEIVASLYQFNNVGEGHDGSDVDIDNSNDDFDADSDANLNDENDDDNNDDDRSGLRTRSEPSGRVANENPIDAIAEKLFKLCIEFLTHRFQQGEAPHSPFLHFSAVLGIDRVHKKFRTASNYTPILAALI